MRDEVIVESAALLQEDVAAAAAARHGMLLFVVHGLQCLADGEGGANVLHFLVLNCFSLG